ncbi:hypothetical protein L3X38_013599 [Prunus dulcis]|uniref:Transposable element protein n=1 Tax=Prunus dulcis TaxID=3755 RepID=A0AAD4WP89_PRUDU|nr:hypothetical protein L3X38_013599 [Prunus dulcis]
MMKEYEMTDLGSMKYFLGIQVQQSEKGIFMYQEKPDIVHTVSVVSRFMNDPSNHHFAAVKRILRYVQGTKGYGIKYTQEKESILVGFTDSDWAGAIDDRRSTSGHVFFLGSRVISWSSKKQSTMALSTAAVEYILATSTACEAVWIRRILADLRQEQNTPTNLYCDNMSTIVMTKNPVFHSRSKHIELRHILSKNWLKMERLN